MLYNPLPAHTSLPKAVLNPLHFSSLIKNKLQKFDFLIFPYICIVNINIMQIFINENPNYKSNRLLYVILAVLLFLIVGTVIEFFEFYSEDNIKANQGKSFFPYVSIIISIVVLLWAILPSKNAKHIYFLALDKDQVIVEFLKFDWFLGYKPTKLKLDIKEIRTKINKDFFYVYVNNQGLQFQIFEESQPNIKDKWNEMMNHYLNKQ